MFPPFIDFQPGETVRARLIRAVHLANGWDLKNPNLALLVGRGVDDPFWAGQVAQWRTDCATTALGFLAAICGSSEAAGKVHPNLARRSVNGMSMPWLMQIGYDLKAWKTGTPCGGDLMHYAIPGTNDDHVEWCLENPSVDFVANHGGGGRANNAITIGTGDIRTSLGRPMVKFLDLGCLAIPDSPPFLD